MTDASLLSQDQFVLLAIIIAIAAYTATVQQFLDNKSTIAKKRGAEAGTLHRAFLDHTREFLMVVDVMLVIAGGLLVVRMFLWARGHGPESLWNWLDLDRLILAQAGVAVLALAGLHLRALMYRMGWIYRKPDHSGSPPDDMSSETVRRVAEKLEQSNPS